MRRYTLIGIVTSVLLLAGAVHGQILAPILRGGGSGPLSLTATTAAPSTTVTLQQITISVASTIDWGDGNTSPLPANTFTVITHVYATAGSYPIRIANTNQITTLDLRDAQLGGLNTAQLRNATGISRFYITAITGSTIRSADMTLWRPSQWYLYSVPAGTYSIASADMAAWRPSSWQLNSMPAGTYSISTADMAAWMPTYWYLTTMPAGTYSIASADMASWLPTTWVMTAMPAGTYSIASANMTSWRPTSWYLSGMPAGTYSISTADMTSWRPSVWYLSSIPAGGTYSIASANMAAWTTVQSIYAYSMPSGSVTINAASNFTGLIGLRVLQLQGNSLSQAQVDTILAGLWAGKATYTYATPAANVGGSNSTPSGVYASTCAPTTGKAYAYDLVNGICTTTGPKWTITYTP